MRGTQVLVRDPERKRLQVDEPKSQKDIRIIPISETIIEPLKRLRQRQRELQLTLGPEWINSNRVITTQAGGPTAYRTVYTVMERL